MAYIEKRISKNNEITFRAQVRIKGCPTQSATFSTKTQAKNWASRTENKIKDGKYLSQIKARKHTIREMIERYLEYVLPQKPKVAVDWKRYLITFQDLIGDYSLLEATPSLIAEARDKIANIKTKKGNLRSGSTVNRYLTALSSVFGIAVREWELLENNPVLKVSKLKEAPHRIRYLSVEERVDLLTECEKANNPYLYPAVILALSTGARKMEILSLKWENVDLENKRVILKDTKNKEVRSLPLVVDGLKEMQKLYDSRKSKIWVFPSKKEQKPFDITRSWRKARKDSKIKDFRFHDLRHTTASYLAMNGATMGEIADILGHKTLQMVKRYAHLSDSHKKSVLEKMNLKMLGAEND
ncbi:MAG: tyrosine-type recombinase/integrase [Alphaproteobacteria bacterium]